MAQNPSKSILKSRCSCAFGAAERPTDGLEVLRGRLRRRGGRLIRQVLRQLPEASTGGVVHVGARGVVKAVEQLHELLHHRLVQELDVRPHRRDKEEVEAAGGVVITVCSTFNCT